MTISVVADIIAGEASVGPDGLAFTRVFHVTTTNNETMLDILQDAGIPAQYEILANTGGAGEFPAVYAFDRNIRPLSEQNDRFRVEVVYSQPDFAQKEPGTAASDSLSQVGSSLSSGKTQVDQAGTQLAVALSGQDTQVGEVEKQTPETVLLFERREATNPLSKSIANTGKVNSAALASGTYPVRTLLCLGIEGVSTDDGETWQVTYRFQYRADTWDATIVYIDPETDRPHNDIDLGTAGAGWITKEIYSKVDFSSLNLPF